MHALKTALGNIPAAALKHESVEKTAEKIKCLLSTFHFVPCPPPSTEGSQPPVSASNGSAAEVGGQQNLPRLLAVPAEAAANKANALKARLRVNVRKNTFNTDLAIAELDKIAADIAHTRNSLEAVRSTTGPSGFGSMESHPYSELHSLTTY